MTQLTRISVACGVLALIFGVTATVMSKDGTWLWIGVLSLLLAMVRVWAEKAQDKSR